MTDIIIQPTQIDENSGGRYHVQRYDGNDERWLDAGQQPFDVLRFARWTADDLAAAFPGERYRVVDRFYVQVYAASVTHVIGDFTIGQPVTWKYTIPRGWNWEVRIPAVIKKMTKKRVLIEAKDKDGELVQRWVMPGKLEARETE